MKYHIHTSKPRCIFWCKHEMFRMKNSCRLYAVRQYRQRSPRFMRSKRRQGLTPKVMTPKLGRKQCSEQSLCECAARSSYTRNILIEHDRFPIVINPYSRKRVVITGDSRDGRQYDREYLVDVIVQFELKLLLLFLFRILSLACIIPQSVCL